MLDLTIDIDGAQQFAHGFRAHLRLEFVTELFGLGQIVVFRHQLTALERRHPRLNDHEGFEVQHTLDVTQRHVEDHPQTRREGLQEPDMGGRAGQLNVAHALPANLGQGDFNAAFFADDAAMLEALVLTAQTFVVFDRPKDLGAEQAIAFGLEGAVIDRLRLLDFTIRPRTNLVGRSEANPDRIKMLFLLYLLEQIQQCTHEGSPIRCEARIRRVRGRCRCRASEFLSPAH